MRGPIEVDGDGNRVAEGGGTLGTAAAKSEEGESKYPFREMNVTDGIVGLDERQAWLIWMASRSYGRRHRGFVCSQRKLEDGSYAVIRMR